MSRSTGCSRVLPSGWLLSVLLTVLLCGTATAAVAQEQYPVRMRIELLSIRNRSASPIPVQIKLEYNRPQILQGDLELELYDALDVVDQEGLLATLKHEDIVLSGTDYIFNTILPPLQTSTIQNLAVVGWFRTDTERIPLSSSLKELDPPQPHDLLMISPTERATLLCSCSGLPVGLTRSPNKLFLDRALSLENYNPLAEKASPGDAAASRSSTRSLGRNIQFYAVSWNSRDLPEDPLAYCCFDIVLLVDGAVARLSPAQQSALLTWVRAGGSLCLVPDAPLKPSQLEFIRSLLEHTETAEASSDLQLDADGGLLVDGAKPQRPLLGRTGLGRAVLLPPVENLSATLDVVELGRVVAHLWKVHRSLGVWQGQPWGTDSLHAALQRMGAPYRRDATGFYRLMPDVQAGNASGFQPRQYISEEQLRQMYNIDDRLAPVRQELALAAKDGLLPDDVEMVPTWVIGLILTAYVLTIGPVDYLVLGMLRIRKATWVVFPIVTACFTLLTIWIAHRYMGSKETGGSIEITDLIDDGQPIRRSRLSLLFFGARAQHQTDHRQQLTVPVEQFWNDPLYATSISAGPTMDRSTAPVPHYAGHFPGNYSITQTIQQWSPQLMRSLELQPTDVDLPQLDWSDPTLVTTSAGRQSLATQLQAQEVPTEFVLSAVALHGQEIHEIYRPQQFRSGFESLDRVSLQLQRLRGYIAPHIPSSLLEATVARDRLDMFRVVSQVSPQGSAVLEDLLLLDADDPAQWVLLIVKQSPGRYQAFRRLYIVPPGTAAPDV